LALFFVFLSLQWEIKYNINIYLLNFIHLI